MSTWNENEESNGKHCHEHDVACCHSSINHTLNFKTETVTNQTFTSVSTSGIENESNNNSSNSPRKHGKTKLGRCSRPSKKKKNRCGCGEARHISNSNRNLEEKKYLECYKKAIATTRLSLEAKEDALSITNDIKKAISTRKQPKKTPKSVTTDSVKEDTSDLTNIFNHVLKHHDAKLKRRT